MAYSVYGNKDKLLSCFLVERAARHHRQRWNGHFVFVYLMCALKRLKEGQLFQRTVTTIVWTFACTCVHGLSAPRCKRFNWKCVLCWVWNVDMNRTDCYLNDWFELFMHVFFMWVKLGRGFMPIDVFCIKFMLVCVVSWNSPFLKNFLTCLPPLPLVKKCNMV